MNITLVKDILTIDIKLIIILFIHLLRLVIMVLTNVKVFFCRGDVRIIIFGTITGGVLQILSKRYLKNHPEFLKGSPESKEILPRGGEITSGSAALAQVILSFLAEHGLTAGLLSSVGVVISQIPITSISTCLRDSVPQNLSHLEKNKFILVKGRQIYLDQCDQNLKYLFNILEDETIPFEERKEIADSVLTKFLNLKTPSGRRNFMLCIVFIISILFTNHRSSFYLMMRSLIKAIREGKITKPMARFIVRKLRKKGLPIDPELAELVESEQVQEQSVLVDCSRT